MGLRRVVGAEKPVRWIVQLQRAVVQVPGWSPRRGASCLAIQDLIGIVKRNRLKGRRPRPVQVKDQDAVGRTCLTLDLGTCAVDDRRGMVPEASGSRRCMDLSAVDVPVELHRFGIYQEHCPRKSWGVVGRPKRVSGARILGSRRFFGFPSQPSTALALTRVRENC